MYVKKNYDNTYYGYDCSITGTDNRRGCMLYTQCPQKGNSIHEICYCSISFCAKENNRAMSIAPVYLRYGAINVNSLNCSNNMCHLYSGIMFYSPVDVSWLQYSNFINGHSSGYSVMTFRYTTHIISKVNVVRNTVGSKEFAIFLCEHCNISMSESNIVGNAIIGQSVNMFSCYNGTFVIINSFLDSVEISGTVTISETLETEIKFENIFTIQKLKKLTCREKLTQRITLIMCNIIVLCFNK